MLPPACAVFKPMSQLKDNGALMSEIKAELNKQDLEPKDVVHRKPCR